MIKREYSKDVMYYFHDLHHIGSDRLRTLEHEYGSLDKVKAVLEHNPYTMMDIDGIGFTVADNVAKTFGIDDRDPRRIRAVFKATLAELCDASTMVTQQALIEGAYGKEGVRHRLGYFVDDNKSMNLLQAQLQSLIDDGKIATVFDDDADDCRNNQRYLQPVSTYEQEHAIIKNVHRLSRSFEPIDNFADEHGEVFIRNGDRGVIKGIDDTERERKYLVRFLADDIVVRYTQQEVYDYLELAYATTVHKSQGSQYDTVVLVMTKNMYPDLLNRNLLYTELTRARRHLILIGNRNMFDMAARIPARERITGLQLL